jgi:hypothetical protein
MKIFQIAAAAGLVIASLGVSTAADAQYRGDRDGRPGWNHGRGDHRGDRRGWRGDRHHQRCWTEWRHHHRVRICR